MCCSCQRTDGIKAWLELKEEEDEKKFAKEKEKREKEEVFNIINEERTARNADRQRMNELKKLQKLKKREEDVDSGVIKETEMIVKDLTMIVETKGMVKPRLCKECEFCIKEKDCACDCENCHEVRIYK